VLHLLGDGDTLVVTRLDRLSRSIRDLANIAHEIEEAGANLKVLEQQVYTSTSAGCAFFGMLAVFAALDRRAPRAQAGRDRQGQALRSVSGWGEAHRPRPCAGAELQRGPGRARSPMRWASRAGRSIASWARTPQGRSTQRGDDLKSRVLPSDCSSAVFAFPESLDTRRRMRCPSVHKLSYDWAGSGERAESRRESAFLRPSIQRQRRFRPAH